MVEFLSLYIGLTMIGLLAIIVIFLCIVVLLLCDWFFGTHVGRRFCLWLFTDNY